MRVSGTAIPRGGHDVKCQYLVDLLAALKERWGDADADFPVVQIEFVWIRPFAHLGKGDVASNVIDAQQLRDNFNWDATVSDVFFKRTAGGQ